MKFDKPCFFAQIFCLGLMLLCLMGRQSICAAEWQWMVPVDSMISDETKAPPQAFLWIPPNCSRVRGVVLGQHNMEEEGILEHPQLRKTLSELELAEVWVSPAIDLFFRFDKGAGENFNRMMLLLAKESGYGELEFAPIIPIGHSAAASFPWNFAAWNPERTIAAISVSGQWPYYKDALMPDWGNRTIDGVPGLVTIGEYEWAADRAKTGLELRRKHPLLSLSMLADPGGGHFDCSENKVAYLAMYIRKAVQYRLPQLAPLDQPVKLRSIDPRKQGWLVDRWRPNQLPKSAAAPVGKYAGDMREAFWCFDEEIAHATEKYGADQRGKRAQLLGYLQNGSLVGQNPKTHQQVTLKFLPVDDGLTFKLTGTFLDTVPEGRPERWTGLPKGSSITHSSSAEPIVISRICGPVVQTAPDTFQIRFYRMGMNNSKRTGEIWLLAQHPGDALYKRAVQQSVMYIPFQNDKGREQHITFPPIPDQLLGSRSVKLSASSDGDVPVYYYVLSGPAEVAGDGLKLTAIPPRAKFPIKVTVVAWQWGRSIPPLLKTAKPIQRSFWVKKK